jgi:glycosyltransferase involved in cell wall biosynthesis
MSDLTIAIPTYDRNVILRDNLARLLPQLTDDCRLLIIDNASPTAVSETLEPLLKSFPRVHAEVVRNRVNLGGSANILRCFELCETKWLWLLGDDDIVSPDAIQTILTETRRLPDTFFFNFASARYPRQQSLLARGLLGFVEAIDLWTAVLFMSVGVYNAPVVRQGLSLGYHFSYSRAPHVAALMGVLSDTGTAEFCCQRIVDEQCLAEATWDPLTTLLGKATLLELIPDDGSRKHLARKLSNHTSLEYLAVKLHWAAQDPLNRGLALYQYDQICSRVYYYDHSFLRRLRIPAYRLLVRWPSLTKPFFSAAFPLLLRMAGHARVRSIELKTPSPFYRI